MRTPRRRAILPIIFLVALLGYTVWPWLPFSRAEATPPTIVFYGFSILAEVMQEAVFPAFQRAWAAEGHGRVEIVSSFGALVERLFAVALVALREPEFDACKCQVGQRLAIHATLGLQGFGGTVEES